MNDFCYRRVLCFLILGTSLKLMCITHGEVIHESGACYTSGVCGFHQIRCGLRERVAVHGAFYGHKPSPTPALQRTANESAAAPVPTQCPSELGPSDCLRIDTYQCCQMASPRDCLLPYQPRHLAQVLHACAGQPACSVQGARSRGLCGEGTRHLSTFSLIQYSCVQEAVVARFCSEHIVWGGKVSALLESSHWPEPESLLGTSCTCELDSVSGEPTSVKVVAMDYRTGVQGSLILRCRKKQTPLLMDTGASLSRRTELSSETLGRDALQLEPPTTESRPASAASPATGSQDGAVTVGLSPSADPSGQDPAGEQGLQGEWTGDRKPQSGTGQGDQGPGWLTAVPPPSWQPEGGGAAPLAGRTEEQQGEMSLGEWFREREFDRTGRPVLRHVQGGRQFGDKDENAGTVSSSSPTLLEGNQRGSGSSANTAVQGGSSAGHVEAGGLRGQGHEDDGDSILARSQTLVRPRPGQASAESRNGTPDPPPRAGAYIPLRARTATPPRVDPDTPPSISTDTPHRASAATPPRVDTDNPPRVDTDTPPRVDTDNPPRADADTPPRARTDTPPREDSTTITRQRPRPSEIVQVQHGDVTTAVSASKGILSQDRNLLFLIAGCVVGCILVLLLLLVTTVCLVRRCRRLSVPDNKAGLPDLGYQFVDVKAAEHMRAKVNLAFDLQHVQHGGLDLAPYTELPTPQVSCRDELRREFVPEQTTSFGHYSIARIPDWSAELAFDETGSQVSDGYDRLGRPYPQCRPRALSCYSQLSISDLDGESSPRDSLGADHWGRAPSQSSGQGQGDRQGAGEDEVYAVISADQDFVRCHVTPC